MKLNKFLQKPSIKTHEGAKASNISNLQQLRRSTMSYLLWEDEFYEEGEQIAQRIAKTALLVNPRDLASLAIEARHEGHLRHVPLLLLSMLCSTGSGTSLVSDTIHNVISRADELAEFVTVYAKVNGTTPDKVKGFISNQMKKGLARAFTKFDEHQLGKYNRDGAIKLRDVLFLCHPKPTDMAQARVWKRLAQNELSTPDTWETELSAGKDKKVTFERLINEQKLGDLALLRNLRGMLEAKVDPQIIINSMNAREWKQTLPFRFTAAARHAPSLEKHLDQAMLKSIKQLPLLKGVTVVMVDVSGSMNASLSAKSDLTRKDAAATLASIINADDLKVYSFADKVMELPARMGMAGVDSITKSQVGGTKLFDAIHEINQKVKYDRLIVITDEQAAESSTVKTCPKPTGRGYMINVASAQNGVGYRDYVHIDGFSENVLKFIYELENEK